MSELSYRIRPARPEDFAAINRLCVEAYQEFEGLIGPVHWQQMRDILAHASDLSAAGELLIAEEAAALLGVVLYVPPGKSDGITFPHTWATIRMLAVSPSGRGRGIGKRLTQECIARARREGAEAVGLATGEMMQIAQPMYERLGFQKDAELDARFGVRQSRYVLLLHPSA